MAKEKADGARDKLVERAIEGRAFDEAIELAREVGFKAENDKIPMRGIILKQVKENL